VNNEAPYTTGLSGDLGWGDADSDHQGGFNAGLLVLVTTGYWASTWLLSGLPPLAFAASQVRKWRNNLS
jgi:hypothetical protein